ncbi:hypothetical protein B9J87_05890 [Vibrio sp. V19_P1S1T109]|uniref:Wadjet anti-phage system protein JetD domain-containing protein n=1 Tax=Vibrio sp. V19_P1S1T109 TaxID=1938672 RepID=UPI000B8E5B3D|nr:Wadjet anti-phage system protein JetD domain-containing protein [Vibrio sp. V19_P1S1T109]OXX73429.1 hypothetical protein B9J87_05890 [Vibrio sp. V19_P1S1T109]
MKLNQYLDKIERGEAINLDRFIRCLPFSDFLEWRNIYQAVRVRGGYQLSIIDSAQHHALYLPIAQDRISAAKSGRSHDFSSSFAHILLLNRHCQAQVPFVVLSDEKGFKTEGQLSGRHAVIIENIENFYRYHAFFDALECSDLADSCDILLGAGNQICHLLNRNFLTQYEVIYCAQDLDLGGLTIFQTLKKSLPQCRWLAPPDWDVHRNQFKLVPKSAEQLVAAIELARELGLSREADILNQTRAFLEQEALLPASPQD